MTRIPTFDDVFAVMAAASVGETDARVPIPADPPVDDPATRLAVALNLLLDDLAQRTTELRRTEEQLRQSQKLEAIGRLAGGVAHDFNNLLSVILTFSTIVSSEIEDPTLRADIEEITKAGQRATDLTRQLLAFSRQQVLEPRVVDINETVSSMGKMLRRVVGEDIEIRTALAPQLAKAKVDPSHLEQVILNLAVNARDAMPGGGTLTLETENVDLDDAYAAAHREVIPGPHVLLAISDSGAGMDKATQERIFEPFFTTKAKGKGTGLGLATVFGIVKQSGGHIWVYSEVGRGSSFKIYLPRTSEAGERAAPESSASAPVRGTERILLVEDDAHVRSAARKVLERGGYHVVEASGPEEALSSIAAGVTVDLVLTDVVMPVMNGRELASRVSLSLPGVRVLFMSGYTENAIVHHGVLDADVALLQKPFTPAALLRKVREVLDAPKTPGR